MAETTIKDPAATISPSFDFSKNTEIKVPSFDGNDLNVKTNATYS